MAARQADLYGKWGMLQVAPAGCITTCRDRSGAPARAGGDRRGRAIAARGAHCQLHRALGLAIAALLLLQFLLGMANVAFALPLALAAAHNAGVALLLAALVVLNFFTFCGLRPSR